LSWKIKEKWRFLDAFWGSGSDPTINCKSKGCGTIDSIIEAPPTHKAGSFSHYYYFWGYLGYFSCFRRGDVNFGLNEMNFGQIEIKFSIIENKNVT